MTITIPTISTAATHPVTGYVLDFAVYNEPITNPQQECPGRWMFNQMWSHFQEQGTTISSIGGNWSGNSTNLRKVNNLTTGGAMNLEDAAKLTNTGLYADSVLYTNVHFINPDPTVSGSVGTIGAAGQYISANVRFTQ